MRHVFTYGSLMYATIWQKLVSQHYQSSAAKIAGFARYGVKNEHYPVIIPEQHAHTQGLLYFNVSLADLITLDQFEGLYYQRQTHLIELKNRQCIQADTYVLKPEFYSISNQSSWSQREFEQHGLQPFTAANFDV